MTTYYVGKGGNDGNAGTSWALRKLTLNGAEDIPVVAGDVVYVGPGAYRELLTIDVSGGAGNEIAYIADVMGENTDNVGGYVRITGSDNDQTTVRNSAIVGTNRNYRTFRGFQIDSTSSWGIDISSCTHWTIEDCSFLTGMQYSIVEFGGATSDITIRRCYFNSRSAMWLDATPADATGNILIENCIILGSYDPIYIRDFGAVTVRNIILMGACDRPGLTFLNVPGGSTCYIYNSIVAYCDTALYKTGAGTGTEDYNILYNNVSDRNGFAVGGNSISGNPQLVMPRLHAGYNQQGGYRESWYFGDHAYWSQINQRTGSAVPSIDMYALSRPTTAAKKGWGPVQNQQDEYEDASALTPPCADADAVKLKDAGTHLAVFSVVSQPVTVEVYVYREAGYAGVLPQMIVKQAGQADRTTTDTGGAASWNLLSDTFTPATTSDVFFVELKSNNTTHPAVNCDVYFACLVFDC